MEKLTRTRSLKRMNEIADADQQETFQRLAQIDNGIEFLEEIQKLVNYADCERDLELIEDIIQNLIASHYGQEMALNALKRRYGL